MRGNLLYYPLSARLLLQVLASWRTFQGVHLPSGRMQLQWMWHFAVSSTRFYSLLHRMNPVSNTCIIIGPRNYHWCETLYPASKAIVLCTYLIFPIRRRESGYYFFFCFAEINTIKFCVCARREHVQKTNKQKKDSCGGWRVWFQEGGGVFSLSMGSNPHLVPTFPPPIGYPRLNIDRHITI